MSEGGAKASRADREAQQTRMILDWIEVVKPRTGEILTLRVPDDQFIHPGTRPEDATAEQIATMEASHAVLSTLIEGLVSQGIRPAGAAILGESMTLESLAAPARPGEPVRRKTGLVLPPGTRV